MAKEDLQKHPGPWNFSLDDPNADIYAVVQHHFDGYKEGVGIQLAPFLNDHPELGDNISADSVDSTHYNILPASEKKSSNGFNCAIPQYIMQQKQKSEVGGVYLAPCSERPQESSPDYAYVVDFIPGAKWGDAGSITVTVGEFSTGFTDTIEPDSVKREWVWSARRMHVQRFAFFCQESGDVGYW